MLVSTHRPERFASIWRERSPDTGHHLIQSIAVVRQIVPANRASVAANTIDFFTGPNHGCCQAITYPRY
jgi:hypothetical protein